MMSDSRQHKTLITNRHGETIQRGSQGVTYHKIDNCEEDIIVVPTTTNHSESQRIATDEFKVKVRSYI